MYNYTLLVHGGAGTLAASLLTPALDASYRQGLTTSLLAGDAILSQGGDALSAVEAAVAALEDDPLFNAGKGAVFNSEGKHELDAALMEGTTLRAGAVAGVQGIRNPIRLARAVMERTEYVLLSGLGAMEFARAQGLQIEAEDYFYNQLRYEQWQQLAGSTATALDHNLPPADGTQRFGTVGAVAVDAQGHVAAATSTGGLTNKHYGRIGDAPLIGCGTYADDRSCAVSCTGDGEFFIRTVAAHEVASLVRYAHLGLQQACEKVIHHQLGALGGEGGLIAVNGQGQWAVALNSSGMYRGLKVGQGPCKTAIYQEDFR